MRKICIYRVIHRFDMLNACVNLGITQHNITGRCTRLCVVKSTNNQICFCIDANKLNRSKHFTLFSIGFWLNVYLKCVYYYLTNIKLVHNVIRSKQVILEKTCIVLCKEQNLFMKFMKIRKKKSRPQYFNLQRKKRDVTSFTCVCVCLCHLSF